MAAVCVFSGFCMTFVPHLWLSLFPPLNRQSASCDRHQDCGAYSTARVWQYSMIRSSPPISLRQAIASDTLKKLDQSHVPFQSYWRAKSHLRSIPCVGNRVDS